MKNTIERKMKNSIELKTICLFQSMVFIHEMYDNNFAECLLGGIIFSE